MVSDLENVGDVLFAKQPIYDNLKNLYGYEILYRDNHNNAASFTSGNEATLKLLTNYCSSIYDSCQQPYVKIFINMPRELILSHNFIPLPPENIVIEILENCKIDDELLLRISELSRLGYLFAIDDLHLVNERFRQLISFCRYVKIDVRKAELTNCEKLIESVCNSLPKNKNITLLAEKVETHSEFLSLVDMKFELFQGYYLSKPQMVYGKVIKGQFSDIFELLTTLQDEDAEIQMISHLVARDAKLSYQLLKIMNSPLCRLPKSVDSIHEAVIFLGLEKLKQWVCILSLSDMKGISTSLMRIVLERAKLCELLANKSANISANMGFTVGLFSVVDVIFECDLEWLLNEIGLSSTVKAAILDYSGPLGEILERAIAYEESSFDVLSRIEYLDRVSLYVAAEESARWANSIINFAR